MQEYEFMQDTALAFLSQLKQASIFQDPNMAFCLRRDNSFAVLHRSPKFMAILESATNTLTAELNQAPAAAGR